MIQASTDFASILRNSPKIPEDNTFQRIAETKGDVYRQALESAMAMEVAGAANKQIADFEKEKFNLRRKEIEQASGGSTRKNKTLALAAFLPAILEGFTGSGRKDENRRMAGQLYTKLLEGQGNALEGFDDTLGLFGSIKEKIASWNRTSAVLDQARRTGQS